MERCERDRVAKICLSCVGHVYANRWFHRRAFKNLKAVTRICFEACYVSLPPTECSRRHLQMARCGSCDVYTLPHITVPAHRLLCI